MPLPSPLPFPADEVRTRAVENLTAAAGEVSRLLLFFRGHEKATHQIEHSLRTLIAIETALENLEWPSSSVSAEWS